MVNTYWIFTAIVALLGIQRIFELRLSKQNEAKVLKAGGKEFYQGHYPIMVLLHSTWFIAMLIEVWFLKPQFHQFLFFPALLFLLLGQLMRYSAIRSLGWRWSTRIMILPKAPPVREGVFKFIRHPNYLGVILEIAAVPLLHSAWFTAIAFTVANAILLWFRIKYEEMALSEHNQYNEHFENQPRFIPRRN